MGADGWVHTGQSTSVLLDNTEKYTQTSYEARETPVCTEGTCKLHTERTRPGFEPEPFHCESANHCTTGQLLLLRDQIRNDSLSEASAVHQNKSCYGNSFSPAEIKLLTCLLVMWISLYLTVTDLFSGSRFLFVSVMCCFDHFRRWKAAGSKISSTFL